MSAAHCASPLTHTPCLSSLELFQAKASAPVTGDHGKGVPRGRGVATHWPSSAAAQPWPRVPRWPPLVCSSLPVCQPFVTFRLRPPKVGEKPIPRPGCPASRTSPERHRCPRPGSPVPDTQTTCGPVPWYTRPPVLDPPVLPAEPLGRPKELRSPKVRN
ncbi:uncharacterized protein LOC109445970 isoform X2 [Rhinolophus sinicus]|uniref:uncharacterized protein LOC109445970 isoform X2 n=1 Tax=Rhinolophus sinicus TaxID=89399 RepID=UPI003D7A76CF